MLDPREARKTAKELRAQAERTARILEAYASNPTDGWAQKVCEAKDKIDGMLDPVVQEIYPQRPLELGGTR